MREDYKHYKGYANHAVQLGLWLNSRDGRWYIASFGPRADDVNFKVVARSTSQDITDPSAITNWEGCDTECVLIADRRQVQLAEPRDLLVTWRRRAGVDVKCEACEASFFNSTATSRASCLACPKGYFNCGGGRQCANFSNPSCAPGQHFHCTDRGATTASCRDCDPGFYSETGSTGICDECTAGRFGAEGRATGQELVERS